MKCIGLYVKCTGLCVKCTGLYVKFTGLYVKCTGLYVKCTGLYVECTGLYCQIFMQTESSRQTFEKCSNIKFDENPSSWSRVFPCGETRRLTDGWTDRHITELIVAFCNFANAPKEDARLDSRKYMTSCPDVKDINIGGGYACYARLMCSVLAGTCTLMLMATDLAFTVRVVRH